MADIRLATGFLDNIKVVKLRRRHGADAVLGLLRLWFYAAEHKPDGVFSHMTEEDIEIICGEHAFSMLGALLDLRFLDATENGYIIHDWDEMQPWITTSPARKEKAKKAAQVRWSQAKESKKQEVKIDAPSMPQAMLNDESSNAPNLTLPNHTLTTEHSSAREDPQKKNTQKIEDLKNLHIKHFGAMLLNGTQLEVIKRWAKEKDYDDIKHAYEKSAGSRPATRWGWIVDCVDRPEATGTKRAAEGNAGRKSKLDIETGDEVDWVGGFYQ